MKSKKIGTAPELSDVRCYCQLPPSAVKKLDARARKEGRSRANLLRIIVLRELGFKS